MTDSKLYIRQVGIIDPTKLTHKIAIIGAGSIGGWTALCLGKLGCQDITVYDFDTVEVHNAGSQVFKSNDEGMDKTQALEERLGMLLEQPIRTVNARWTPEVDLSYYDIVIAAVDSITPRSEIYNTLLGHDKLYIDARMAGNAIEIYTTKMNDQDQCLKYEKTLFAEEDALPVACSERSVVYNVFVVAGLIGDYVAKWANDESLPKETIVDLYNLTMFKTL